MRIELGRSAAECLSLTWLIVGCTKVARIGKIGGSDRSLKNRETENKNEK